MRVTSEGPTKITKATIDAAWRRRKPDHRLIVRDKDCRGLALIVNPTTMTWSYAYRPRGTDPVTGRRWPNRTVTLGNPARTPRRCARRGKPDQGAGRRRRRSGGRSEGQAEATSAASAAPRWDGLSRITLRACPRRPKMRGTGLPSPDYVAEELAQCRLALADLDAEDMPAVTLSGRAAAIAR